MLGTISLLATRQILPRGKRFRVQYAETNNFSTYSGKIILANQ